MGDKTGPVGEGPYTGRFKSKGRDYRGGMGRGLGLRRTLRGLGRKSTWRERTMAK